MRETVGRVLWRAAEDEDFRRRALYNLGAALAEEGFILSDMEMSLLREQWEVLCGLPERDSYARVMALARSYRR